MGDLFQVNADPRRFRPITLTLTCCGHLVVETFEDGRVTATTLGEARRLDLSHLGFIALTLGLQGHSPWRAAAIWSLKRAKNAG